MFGVDFADLHDYAVDLHNFDGLLVKRSLAVVVRGWKKSCFGCENYTNFAVNLAVE